MTGPRRSQLILAFLSIISLAACSASLAEQTAQCAADSAAWTPGAWQKARQSLSNGLSVVYVLDPNFLLCWEIVPVDRFTNTTLLPWLRELKDALTVSESGEGEDMQVLFFAA